MNIFNLFKIDKNKQKNTISNSETKVSQPLEIKATKANKLFVDNINKPSDRQFSNAYQLADVVYSCVSYAADIASQLTFQIYTLKGNVKKPYKNQKVMDWFNQPNPFFTMSEIIFLYIQSYLLTGNAYLTFEKIGASFEGWVLDPTLMQIVPHQKKYIDGFIYNETVPYKNSEIIFFRNPYIGNAYYGLSYLAVLVDPMEIEGYAIDDLKEFYKKSLIAQGILSSEFPLSENQIKSLREQFYQLYGLKGSNRHGFIVAPNNLKFQPIRINPKDGMLLEALGISEERIYKVFRLNPALLGVGKDSVTGTELKEIKKIYVNNFIRPIIYRMTKTWESFFRRVLKEPTLVIEPDYSLIPEVNTALEEKMSYVKEGVSIGLISYNEGRDVLGLPPVDGEYMDGHLAPSFLFGTAPIDLTSGQAIQLSPSNQQQAPKGSTNPSGGSQDGVSR